MGGVIKGILQEELDNSLRMKSTYEVELAKLPKGSLVRKIIKGLPYYYVVSREQGKVRFVYKGKVSADDIKKYQDAKESRARYRKLLSQAKKQIKFLRSSLRAKESV